jgi:SAM-dependent methyltransferase
MVQNFLDYSKYYDLLYREKDYEKEASFIIQLIKKKHPNAKKILNLGCGTGQHDLYFAKAGYQVTGVDLSKDMLDLAIEKNKDQDCTYLLGDVRNLQLDTTFDVIISLFHVFSYQTTNEDVTSFFATLKKHMKPDSICIVDYWYAPAVINLKPENKVKRINSDELNITRYTTSSADYFSSLVKVEFKIIVENRLDGTMNELNEIHNMRFFTINEIDLFSGMSQLKGNHFAWLETNQKPTIETWSAYSLFEHSSNSDKK